MTLEIIETRNSEIVKSPRLEVPRDRRGRVRWNLLGDDPNLRKEVIELEAGSLLEDGKSLTKEGLLKSQNNTLLRAVQRFYPGSLSGLRANLGLESKAKPAGFWTPEKVEQEARAFYEAESDLTQKLLYSKKRNDLIGAIRKYPDQMRGLKSKLGVSQRQKPKGYWTPEIVKQEAQDFFEKEGDISQSLLTQRGRNDLSVAIGKYYPGKLTQLKVDLGQTSTTKPDGYWLDPENIKKEALDFIATHKSLSLLHKMRNSGYSSLYAAISSHYPGGWKGLRTDLGIGQVRKPKGYWTPQVIEETTKKLVSPDNSLTEKSLVDSGNAALLGAIDKKYPGGFSALKEKLGFDPSQRPAGYWKNQENIENEARKLVTQGFTLTQVDAQAAGVSPLTSAIRDNYPGGFEALRKKLGIKEGIGHWKHIKFDEFGLPRDRAGRIIWIYFESSPEKAKSAMEAYARKLVLEGSNLTMKDLNSRGESSFAHHFHELYPGGLPQLRVNLNLSQLQNQWTKERVIEEVRTFLNQQGTITEDLLRKQNQHGLMGAIIRYFGGFRALKEELKLAQASKPNGFWTPERIKAEAAMFLENEGRLTQTLLSQRDRNDLEGAITRNYPGGLRQLQLDLGLPVNKPNGYWTIETIEQEATSFLQQEGQLTQNLLIGKGRHDLVIAIGRKYPGKLIALKKKLGISNGEIEPGISPDEANEQLRKLLEDNI